MANTIKTTEAAAIDSNLIAGFRTFLCRTRSDEYARDMANFIARLTAQAQEETTHNQADKNYWPNLAKTVFDRLPRIYQESLTQAFVTDNLSFGTFRMIFDDSQRAELRGLRDIYRANTICLLPTNTESRGSAQSSFGRKIKNLVDYVANRITGHAERVEKDSRLKAFAVANLALCLQAPTERFAALHAVPSTEKALKIRAYNTRPIPHELVRAVVFPPRYILFKL